MNTVHISAAVNRMNVSPAPPANSSLADFLLAGASGNGNTDFRSIAAALFGVETPAENQVGASPKDSNNATAKKATNGLPSDESESRKKEAGDPASAILLHPELTAPVIVTPGPALQIAGKAETEATSTSGTKGMKAGLDAAETLANRLPIEPEMLAAQLAGNTALAASAKPETSTEGLDTDQRDEKASAFAPAGSATETPADLPQSQMLGVSTPAGNDLPPGKKLTAQGIEGAQGVAGKKSSESAKAAGARSQESAVPGLPKHDATPHADPNVATAKVEAPRVAAVDSVPVTPLPAQVSPAKKETAGNPLSTKAVTQPNGLDPALAAEARKASGYSPASELAKAKSTAGRDRSGKEKIGKDQADKDLHTGTTDSGKLSSTPAGRAVTGAASVSGGNKDGAGLSSANHSGAQVRASLAKESAGSAPSSGTLMDMDGPDETLPATMSSPVNAKFVQGMSQSEFRVGMQSQEFGNIDIRTSVSRHMFTAQISVEHSDVAKSMATELPALYSKLADQHVPVANIVIQGQGLGTSSGFAQDAQQPRTWSPQHGQGGGSTTEGAVLPVVAEALASEGRLDIRI